MKYLSTAIPSILFCSIVYSQNPITPPGVYIADPSAHVWKDGKLYIYGSLDESCDYYCSWKHHVMVTGDMKNWTIHEMLFPQKGLEMRSLTMITCFSPPIVLSGTILFTSTIASPINQQKVLQLQCHLQAHLKVARKYNCPVLTRLIPHFLSMMTDRRIIYGASLA